jgi:protein-S-isoprenylcysteine O-methyltransferase Ste14
MRSDEDVRDQALRDRRGRRAIAWGSGIVVVGFAIGCVLSFLPAATGVRMPTVLVDWVVVVGALAIGLIGIAFTLYGVIELMRARPPRRERHA